VQRKGILLLAVCGLEVAVVPPFFTTKPEKRRKT
jgi:hypothetical protein